MVRIEDPIQQGLRHAPVCRRNTNDNVRIEDPIQQGLRHTNDNSNADNSARQNRRSNTTRIKTRHAEYTRSAIAVRIEDPIQQGLRPLRHGDNTGGKLVRIEDPIQQGLRPVDSRKWLSIDAVRIEDPIQQGLRLLYTFLKC